MGSSGRTEPALSAVVILSLTTVSPVKRSVATLRRGRCEWRHFALVESIDSQTKVVIRFQSRSGTSGSTIHLFGTSAHDCSVRSPCFSGRQAAHSSARLLLAGHRMTRAHLHNGLTELRVRPVFTQHQVQPRGQFSGHGHLGDAAILGPPGDDRSVSAADPTAPRSVPLPPAKSAETNCPVC